MIFVMITAGINVCVRGLGKGEEEGDSTGIPTECKAELSGQGWKRK